MNPTESEIKKLREVDKLITCNVHQAIKELNYADKITFVEMQGSYAKNTDLSGSSDLDLFVGFDKSVPRDEFERIGLEIGHKALSQHNPYKRFAEHPFTEAFVDGVEVQIVPAYDITLEDIKNGKMLSATDRTPHQTRFMNDNLSVEQKEDVRTLKQFMKDNNVYGSDERIKGFSGYSAEVLIHEIGSFANVIDFFANFVKGTQVGKPSHNFDTLFVIVDPIDSNRNLVSAFSNEKIARMVKVSRKLLDIGSVPKLSTSNVESIGLSFNYEERSDDKLFGQINRTITAIENQLRKSGYKTKREYEKITNNWISSTHRTSYTINKETKTISMYFGLENFDNNKPITIRGPPLTIEVAVKQFRKSNPNSEIIEKDGRLVRYEERKCKTAEHALRDLLTNRLNQSGISGEILKDIETNGFATEGRELREFENIV